MFANHIYIYIWSLTIGTQLTFGPLTSPNLRNWMTHYGGGLFQHRFLHIHNSNPRPLVKGLELPTTSTNHVLVNHIHIWLISSFLSHHHYTMRMLYLVKNPKFLRQFYPYQLWQTQHNRLPATWHTLQFLLSKKKYKHISKDDD